MEQFNGVAKRVNSLLDTVEEPIKAFVPQITRTIKAADMMVDQLSAPIEKVAPGLSRLADTLSTPALANMPRDLGQFMDVLTDLARRLQPLGQLAESAGSMFGLRPLASLRTGATRPAPIVAPPAPRRAAAPAKKAPVKKAAAKKAHPKKAPAKKSKR